MNFVTAPLIADLFLLAISAIGREEVRGGTIGADHISPIDIMLFFITLAYIAISIDASGLIRWLAYKVLLKGGKSGRRLFLYLYAFFALLGSFIGNDPIILSGTPFLAYMTRVSSNIQHPRAWIFSQFAVSNVVSAILVSSNPTNLVLAGAFQIRFVDYTVNMIVPVIITAVVLFPFLLFLIFRNEKLIPRSIVIHELPEEMRAEPPKNPCIPWVKGAVEAEETLHSEDDKGRLLDLAEIMHPFLDKKSAIFGSVVMAVTLITVLVLNATSPTDGELPVFWITLPAAVVMFCWDMVFGWVRREEARSIAQSGCRELEEVRAEGLLEEEAQGREARRTQQQSSPLGREFRGEKITTANEEPIPADVVGRTNNESGSPPNEAPIDGEKRTGNEDQRGSSASPERTTIVSLVTNVWAWSRETYPTATFVLAHLPLSLVPFAFTMFVLVQALVTKGWVPVFAHGWDEWVSRTGTVGAITGMAFVSAILCNASRPSTLHAITVANRMQFTGTNIGTTILLCRIIQAWQALPRTSGDPISDRTFWATVYSMALGVNYGAFSAAFSASLAGLLWRDILRRKRIHIRARDFARYNVPIIAVAMVVGCAALVGEVYIVRGTEPYASPV